MCNSGPKTCTDFILRWMNKLNDGLLRMNIWSIYKYKYQYIYVYMHPNRPTELIMLTPLPRVSVYRFLWCQQFCLIQTSGSGRICNVGFTLLTPMLFILLRWITNGFLFWILAEYRVAWQKRQIGKCSDNKMTLGWWNINRQIVSLFTRRFAVDFCINVVNQIYVKPVRHICCYLVHSKFEYAFNSALRPRYAILPSVTLSSIETVRHLMPSYPCLDSSGTYLQ